MYLYFVHSYTIQHSLNTPNIKRFRQRAWFSSVEDDIPTFSFSHGCLDKSRLQRYGSFPFVWTVPVRSRAPSVGSSNAPSGRSLTNTFPFNAQDGEEHHAHGDHHGHHGEHHEWMLIPTTLCAGNDWTVEKSLQETLSGAAILKLISWFL